MLFGLYILYALVQAILTARYFIEDRTAPVFMVVIMTIGAPIVSAILIISGFNKAVEWLVTYRSPANKP